MTTTTTTYEFVHDKFGVRPTDTNNPISESSALDLGRVALLAVYGSDEMIADTARVSYGKGTKKSRDRRALIRYLVRHRHTSPLESAEVVFYLKAPIFVIRQLIRHRTANVNEYSARYSELSDDFYVPPVSYLGTQSTTNMQGRDGAVDPIRGESIRANFYSAQQNAMDSYKQLLGDGISRELARVVTPVGVYTELYWKCDLHNFLHFLKLRMDPHAQQEIRDYANIMCMLAQPHFPDVFDAWRDYVLNARTLSALEFRALRALLKDHVPPVASYPTDLKMSDREKADFRALLDDLLA